MRDTDEAVSLVCRVEKHEMARQRRLHRVVGGLLVADLAHHHDVGVLPEHGAQRGGEGDVDLRTHRHLVEILDRPSPPDPRW
jgi:hypothetical protein